MDYYSSPEYKSHRKNIHTIIKSLPFRESPPGWSKAGDFAVGGLKYIGFSADSRYLLVVSSSGRGVIDLASMEKIARDNTPDGDWMDENNLLCTGIPPMDNAPVRLTGINGGGLPRATPAGESLYLAATDYPRYDAIYQPPYQNCLIKNHNKNCAVIYQGFINHLGFSWNGNIMAVIDEDIHLWKRV